MKQIQQILKEYWGYDHFRPLQEDIINAVLEGNDTLALLPTGGGKSICFQVPALAKPGLCIVISPLIALMKDQVEQLVKRGIDAYAIYSGQSNRQVNAILTAATEGECKFLYVSPERLETRLFQEYLPSMEVSLIAVDESHCISQWGYDFRPSYLKIALLRTSLPGVPVLALTASATELVQNDIMEKLEFSQKKIFRQSFSRPNLSYSVIESSSRINNILHILKNVPGSGIIYCKTRRKTRELSNLLNMHGLQTDFYHAGLEQEVRNKKQEAWIKNELRIIVCTNAFGMGIDKPDVRVVIHAEVPDCLENYYQEAGRAGRDGKKSYAVLLFSDEEISKLYLQPSIKYPDFSFLREVFSSLMNFLQIPVYSGAGIYYDFDFNKFITSFNIEPTLAINALKALEQEDFITLNEQVFLPSTAMFTCSRQNIEDFEALHPAYESFIKTMLRSYEGIFDQQVYIYENNLAFRERISEEEVFQKLQLLHKAGIIEYSKRKTTPQIYMQGNHVPANELVFNYNNYKERKKNYTGRVNAMIGFIRSRECRSRYIGRYFGDTEISNCNVCDNCIASNKKPLSAPEYAEIEKEIKSYLKKNGYTSPEILIKNLKYSRNNINKVLDFLMAEESIRVNEKGEVGVSC